MSHIGKMDPKDVALVRLADALRLHNRMADARTEFTSDHLRVLAEFFQHPGFNKEKWIDYVTGVTSHCPRAGG